MINKKPCAHTPAVNAESKKLAIPGRRTRKQHQMIELLTSFSHGLKSATHYRDNYSFNINFQGKDTLRKHNKPP